MIKSPNNHEIGANQEDVNILRSTEESTIESRTKKNFPKVIRNLDILIEDNIENDDVFSDSINDFNGNSYTLPPSAKDLERSKSALPDYELILGQESKLEILRTQYLEQYHPESEARAELLYKKDMVDHYVLGRLRSNNASDFINSNGFKNYASYIISTARAKTQVVNGKKYFPELTTNPVLSIPEYRKLILSKLKNPADTQIIFERLNRSEAEYKDELNKINDKLETSKKVSQDELDTVGDFLYSGRDFEKPIAKNFACYLYNNVEGGDNIKSSTQIGGALANYFAYKNTLDERLRERRFLMANKYGWDQQKNAARDAGVGLSTSEFSILSQELVAKMSLTSDEGLKKSRPDTIRDLYSLMLVSYHELTHDYQKLMMADGSKNTSAMSYILHRLLMKNRSDCFPILDRDLNPALDEAGNKKMGGYYAANHDNDEIEIEADEKAWRQCRVFIAEHERNYPPNDKDKSKHDKAFAHWSKCLDNTSDIEARRAFTLKIDENGNKMPYIQYDLQQAGKAIQNNPDSLSMYPQLAAYFNEYGKIKPQTFFNEELASISFNGFDDTTDNFGVEIATYALMTNTATKEIISYVQDKNIQLSESQVNRCLYNLYNTLHQNVLKVRGIKGVDFDTYSETRAHGKDTSVKDIKEYHLKQYLFQLLSCTYIAENLRNRYPQFDKNIDHLEKTYFTSYFDELKMDVNLTPQYIKNVKDAYLKSNNVFLKKLTEKM